MTTKNTRVLYHVTLDRKMESIRELGISPAFAIGGRAVYLVDYERIPWAIIHVAMRHAEKLHNLVIYKCVVQKTAIQTLPTLGLFKHRNVVVPASFTFVLEWHAQYTERLGKIGWKIERHRKLAEAIRKNQEDLNDIPF